MTDPGLGIRAEKVNRRNEHPFHDLRKYNIIPMDAFAASTISFALSSSPTISVSAEILSSDNWDLSSTNFATLAYR